MSKDQVLEKYWELKDWGEIRDAEKLLLRYVEHLSGAISSLDPGALGEYPSFEFED